MNKQDRKRMYEIKNKKGWIAIVLSLILTGSGNMYAGKIAKGFFFMFLQCVLWFVLLGWIMWVIAPISAYNDVKEYNELLRIKYQVKEE